jgi:hypothetical protein
MADKLVRQLLLKPRLAKRKEAEDRLRKKEAEDTLRDIAIKRSQISRESEETEQEALKQSFEVIKQLATLSAGSIVLLATFLKGIFPKDAAGALAVSLGSKWLIATSFVLIGASLLACGIYLYAYKKQLKYLRTRKLITQLASQVQVLDELYYHVGTETKDNVRKIRNVFEEELNQAGKQVGAPEIAQALASVERSQGSNPMRSVRSSVPIRLRAIGWAEKWSFGSAVASFILGLSCFGAVVLFNLL